MYSMTKKPSAKKSVDKKMPAAATGMPKSPPMMVRGTRTATNRMTKAKRGK